MTTLFVLLGVCVVGTAGFVVYLRRVPGDDLVDQLISLNTARPIPGMEGPNYARLERYGSERTVEVLRAERRREDERLRYVQTGRV